MAKREEREPLFRLDLGKNGGTWAPYSGEEMMEWINREVTFWTWIQGAPGYNHKSSLDLALSQLHQAQAAAQRYVQGTDLQNMLGQVQAHVRTAYVDMRLPQSSTAAAKEAEGMRQESPERAVAYLFTQMPNPNNYRFESNNPSAWHAFVLGLMSAFGGLPGIDRSNAQRAALDELLADGRKLLSDRRGEYDTLHADLQLAIAEGREQSASQATKFTSFLEKAKGEHASALEKHTQEMLALRKAFREEMTLRGPVEYWKSRQQTHKNGGIRLIGIFIVLLALTGVTLWFLGTWVVDSSVGPKTSPPDTWRLAVMAFVAAIGVWMLRLVIRVFLSHQHLATDAAERVTMVQTYLALIESDKLPKDEDRKLILQSLFRPGSDGIVKDDGIPNPVLDALTKVK